MGTIYNHLTIEERCEMARLQREGYSKRQIATNLDRSASTISRELSRNGSRKEGYNPSYADDQAWARRWRGSKLDRDPDLREQVLAGLQAAWSPEQVAGRLALEVGHPVVSHETIYRFVHAQGNRTKDHGLVPPPSPREDQTGPAPAPGRPPRFLHSPTPPPGPAAQRS